MKLYCYSIPPIDFWFGVLTEQELLERLEIGDRERAVVLKSEAEACFRTIQWEGDVRDGPFYFAIPNETEMALGYVIKQDNNGNCFVASPIELPHLNTLAFDAAVHD